MLLHLFWLLFQSCFRPLASELFFLKVLFFTALVGATFFRWMLLLSLFFRPSSFCFYSCRHLVRLLSLLIVSVLGFPWGLPFYPGSLHSGTVHLAFQYGYFICSECFFFSHLLRLLLPSSTCERFCLFS